MYIYIYIYVYKGIYINMFSIPISICVCIHPSPPPPRSSHTPLGSAPSTIQQRKYTSLAVGRWGHCQNRNLSNRSSSRRILYKPGSDTVPSKFCLLSQKPDNYAPLFRHSPVVKRRSFPKLF